MSPAPDTEAATHGTKAEPLRWDVDMEVQLFYAMAPYKPVGINKHFHMTAIWEKLSNSIAKDITTSDIWRHIDTLYDVSVLDDTEPIPFSTEEIEFSLPDDEFGEYLKRKSLDISTIDYNEDVPSPQTKSPQKSTPRSTSKDGKRKDSLGSTKTRKESGSSHASTDTTTNKSDKDFGSGSRSDRRNSRDSNASGTRESLSGRKSTSAKKTPKSRTGRPAAETSWTEDSERGSRSKRRTNTSTPPPTPAKRRRV